MGRSARPPGPVDPVDPAGDLLWQRVKASVRPLRRAAPLPIKRIAAPPVAASAPQAPPIKLPRGRTPAPLVPAPAPPIAKPIGSAPVDKAWEKRIGSGRLVPDTAVDLHGHNLAGAHAALSRALDGAAQRGLRVILVIAGKSRGPAEAPRGAIRRELTTWLAHSHHAPKILAVRNAHPRHGGDGAVYVVLRK